MPTRQRVVQVAIVAVVEVVTLLLLPRFIGGLTVNSWQAALGAALAFTVAQVVFWWVFIRFFAWLPAWLYPVLTFVLTGAAVMLFGNLIPGITIANIGTGIWITVVLTAVNAILASLLSLDVDEQFDRNVTRQLVARRGSPIHDRRAGLRLPGDRRARRGALPPRPGRGPPADAQALARRRHAHDHRLGDRLLGPDRRDAARHPAGQQRRDPRLPLVGPRAAGPS